MAKKFLDNSVDEEQDQRAANLTRANIALTKKERDVQRAKSLANPIRAKSLANPRSQSLANPRSQNIPNPRSQRIVRPLGMLIAQLITTAMNRRQYVVVGNTLLVHYGLFENYSVYLLYLSIQI